MATPNRLTGGGFQDAIGNPLAFGYLEFQLSQDASTSNNTQVAAGHIVRINLDAEGDVSESPAQSVWANDDLLPSNTFYNVSAFSAQGQLVWGPNAQQILSTPSPYDIGDWVPGTVNIFAGAIVLAFGVTGTFSSTTLAAGDSETVSFNLPGVIVGSPVIVSSTDGTLQPIGIVVEASVIANGIVTIRQSNVTSGTITTFPAAYNVRCFL